MNCSNCNAPLNENDTFCSNCGTPVNQAPKTPPEVTQIVGATPQEPRKKFPKIPLIIAGVVLILIIALGVFNASAIENMVKRQFSSPKDYLKYIVERDAKRSSDMIANVYGNYITQAKKQIKQTNEVDYKFTVGKPAKDLFKKVAGSDVDIDWLDTLSVKTLTTIDKKQVGTKTNLTINDTPITDVISIMTNEGVSISVPTISPDELYSEVDDDVPFINVDKFLDFYDNLPDKAKVKTVLKNYASFEFDSGSNYKASSDSISAGDLSVPVYAITREYSPEDMKDSFTKLADKMSKDKDLKEVFKKTYNAYFDLYNENYVTMLGLPNDPDEAYDKLINKLDDFADDYDNTASTVKVTTWIDSFGNVIGNKSESDNGVTVNSFEYKLLTKGGKFAIYISVKEDDNELFGIEGNGKLNLGKASGNITLYKDDDIVSDLKLKTLDLTKLKSGVLETEFEVIPNSEFIDSSGIADMALSDFTFGVKSSKDKASFTIKHDSSDFLNLDITAKVGKPEKIEIKADNSYDISNSSDMQDYFKDADFDKLLDNLENAGVSQDILDELENSISYMTN
jgi:hypothetical protein